MERRTSITEVTVFQVIKSVMKFDATDDPSIIALIILYPLIIRYKKAIQYLQEYIIIIIIIINSQKQIKIIFVV